MPSPILAACITFHVLTPEVHGPFFADEVAVVQKAVAARVARLPNHCRAQNAQPWVELAASRRTRPKGPLCAAPPSVSDLLKQHGVDDIIRPSLDSGGLTFYGGGLMFEVPLAYGAPRRWPGQVARAQGFHGGRIGGVSRRPLVGSPVGVAVDLYQQWKTTDLKVDLEAASAALASCHEAGPDPHLSIGYTVVAALDADGIVTRVEHRDDEGSEASRACVAGKIRSLRFPPGATRAVLFVIDRAAQPIPPATWRLNFMVAKAPGLIDSSPLYDEPRFHRCALPRGETPFTLELDVTGRVTEAKVPGLEDEVRLCAEEALRHVAFTCPKGGAGRVEGRIEVR